MSDRATIHISGGPMSGLRFAAEVHAWPPPRRLIGSDIHANMVGTYELQEATDGVVSRIARYKLREDDDYRRIVRNVMVYLR